MWALNRMRKLPQAATRLLLVDLMYLSVAH